MKRERDSEEVELEQERMAAYRKSHGCEGTEEAQRVLQPLVDEFAVYQKTLGRTPATWEGNRTNLKYWQRYLASLGVSTLEEVTPQIAAGFQAWVFHYRTRFGRPFTLTSQIRVLNSVQVFYQFLMKTEKILSNPVNVIEPPKVPKRLPAVLLSAKEMKKLLAQPDPSTVLGFRDRTMYEVLYSTGIRIGELIRLRVQDLQLSEGTLFLHAGKGRKDRVVPLGATACRYLAEYRKNIRPFFREAIHAEEVFFNKHGRPLKKHGILNKLKVYALRAGIKKRITVHTFRHTLATEMLKRGADLRQIQEMLGHASLRTTQLYTHIVKGELKRVQEQCHPREQTALPEGFVCYRGRNYLLKEERRQSEHVRQKEKLAS